MPIIRYFTVTETREIKVLAPSAIVAAEIGNKAFVTGESDVNINEGRTISSIKITALDVREDY